MILVNILSLILIPDKEQLLMRSLESLQQCLEKLTIYNNNYNHEMLVTNNDPIVRLTLRLRRNMIQLSDIIENSENINKTENS